MLLPFNGSNDALYTPTFETLIAEFCTLCNTSMTMAKLAPILATLQTSDILATLANDPTNEPVKMCVRMLLDQKPHLPSDFLHKFITVHGTRVNLRSVNGSFMNPQYQATVVISNTIPTRTITHMTVASRIRSLKRDMTRGQIVKRNPVPARTLKLIMSDELLDQCIRAIGDLDHTIVEGNRANNYTLTGSIRTTRRTRRPE